MLLLSQRSTLSFLRFVRLYFSKYQLFPLWDLSVCTSPNINFFLLGVCPSVLLQISILSFLGFACLYFSKYQLFPLEFARLYFSNLFVRLYSSKYKLIPFWLRLHAASLYLCAIIPFSIYHIIGRDVHSQKGPEYTLPSHLLDPLCCAGKKDEKQVL